MAKEGNGERLFGAHVRGGITGAVESALEIGAQSMQIFIGSPQTWREPTPGQTDMAKFVSQVKEHSLGPVFVHGNYLVNLASTSDINRTKSIDNLSRALRLSDRIGAVGLIFHPGSAKDLSCKEAMRRVIEAIQTVLADYSGACKLLLETCAGQGQTIGDKFLQFKEIFASLGNDKRLGVCWDTCHLYNAGYDVSSAEGLERTVDEFDKQVGFPCLYAIHANDSKTPLGARKDRHENIGCGHIDEEGFRRLLAHHSLKHLPWILEVPGFDNKGPDRKNIEILYRLSGNID